MDGSVAFTCTSVYDERLSVLFFLLARDTDWRFAIVWVPSMPWAVLLSRVLA